MLPYFTRKLAVSAVEMLEKLIPEYQQIYSIFQSFLEIFCNILLCILVLVQLGEFGY